MNGKNSGFIVENLFVPRYNTKNGVVYGTKLFLFWLFRYFIKVKSHIIKKKDVYLHVEML